MRLNNSKKIDSECIINKEPVGIKDLKAGENDEGLNEWVDIYDEYAMRDSKYLFLSIFGM